MREKKLKNQRYSCQQPKTNHQTPRGITLVALIITVIILLILAGVAISMITGEDGIFTKANTAATEYNKAAYSEAQWFKEFLDSEWLNISASGGNGGFDDDIDEPKEPETIPIEESGIAVGHYVAYKAGSWTADDITKITESYSGITVHSSVNDTTEDNQTTPTTQGEFGGFEIGDSRDENSTPYDTNYIPKYSGWRVWDIDESTGQVTLISAGHPETYYHGLGYSEASVNILTNRNWSMYENEYAVEESAKILTGEEAVEWYNKQFNTTYTLATWVAQTFETKEPISVLENSSYYWLASVSGSSSLYNVLPPNGRCVFEDSDKAFGVRILVTLKADVLLEKGTGNGSEDSPWKIAGVIN